MGVVCFYSVGHNCLEITVQVVWASNTNNLLTIDQIYTISIQIWPIEKKQILYSGYSHHRHCLVVANDSSILFKQISFVAIHEQNSIAVKLVVIPVPF